MIKTTTNAQVRKLLKRIEMLESELEQEKQKNRQAAIEALTQFGIIDGFGLVKLYLSLHEQAVIEGILANEVFELETVRAVILEIFKKTAHGLRCSNLLRERFSAGSELLASLGKTPGDVIKAVGEVVTEPEANAMKAEVEATKEAIKTVMVESGAMYSSALRHLKAAETAVKALAEVKSSSNVLDAAKKIAEIKHPKESHTKGDDLGEIFEALEGKAKTTPMGRKISKCTVKTQKLSAKEKTQACPGCEQKMLRLGESAEERIKTLARSITDNACTQTNFGLQLWYCPRCNEVVANIPEGADVPVKPSQSIGQRAIVAALVDQLYGSPIHRFESMYLRDMKFGGETFNKRVLEFSTAYLQPLWEHMKRDVHMSVLLADETTYSVLQSQGRGNTEAKAEDVRTSANWVEVFTNTKNDEKQLRGFEYINGRGKDAIESCISQFDFEVLATDGHKPYKTLMQTKYEGRLHQVCLVHFRRKILNALGFKAMIKENEGLTDKDLAEHFVMNSISGNTLGARHILVLMLDALAKIFGYEKELALDRENYKKRIVYLNHVTEVRKQNARPLMDAIGELVQELSAQTEVTKHGPYRDVCSYWNTYSEQMRTFLTNPEVPCHTNAVESAVRAIVIIRQSKQWVQSEDGMRALCTAFSVMDSGLANGLDARDLERWIVQYGQAVFKYCFEARWKKEIVVDKTDKLVDRRFQDWNMTQLQAGFNYEPWLPWNWIKRQS